VLNFFLSKERLISLSIEILPHDNPAPARDDALLNALADDAKTFLDQTRSGVFDRRWGAQQDTILSRICHTLLIAGRTIQGYEGITPCALIYAEHLFLE